MIMMGLFYEKVPFHSIYIHPLVRDEKGEKCQSQKVMYDPLKLIELYGADPLRYTLVNLSPSQDIKLSNKLVENSRNFITNFNVGFHSLIISGEKL